MLEQRSALALQLILSRMSVAMDHLIFTELACFDIRLELEEIQNYLEIVLN